MIPRAPPLRASRLRIDASAACSPSAGICRCAATPGCTYRGTLQQRRKAQQDVPRRLSRRPPPCGSIRLARFAVAGTSRSLADTRACGRRLTPFVVSRDLFVVARARRHAQRAREAAARGAACATRKVALAVVNAAATSCATQVRWAASKLSRKRWQGRCLCAEREASARRLPRVLPPEAGQEVAHY